MRRIARVATAVAIALPLAACATEPSGGDESSVLELGEDDRGSRSPGNGAVLSENEIEGAEANDVVVPDMYPSEESSAERGFAAAVAPTTPVTFFVNKDGGTYTSGRDNASQRVSSVLTYVKKSSVTFPPAGYAGARWQEYMSCLASILKPYNVRLTDVRPANGGYAELVVSNTSSSILGLSGNTTGIAPLGSCRVVPQAIGYVFHRLYDQQGYGGLRGACEAGAHEIGHTLSLSHEQLASDIMAYSATNPSKRFQDAASACGTSSRSPESCSCGGPTQNSHQQLLTLVGAAGASPSPSPAPSPTPVTVSIVSPANGATLPGNGTIQVAVESTGDARLAWEYSQRTLPCDASVQGVTCTKNGTRFTWSISVGTGARTFHAIAGEVRTPSVSIELTGAAPAPAANASPSVTFLSPSDGQTVARGGQLVFRANAEDDVKVNDVRAIWIYSGGSLAIPMALANGAYEARVTISATAAPGTRQVEIQATDDTGLRTVTARRAVVVQ